MTLLVPETGSAREMDETLLSLGEALASLMDFIGATAGSIGWRDTNGGLTFPVRRGDFPESWLSLQQSPASVWGFAVCERPTLLNDLRPWAPLGEPPLHNLLCCPLRHGNAIVGHVTLANKPHGFNSHDAAVLQGMAHHMMRLLNRPPTRSRSGVPVPVSWRRILDRASEGILLLDDRGRLVYANTTWLNWTGFAAEDLLGLLAPFPFWVSPHDLVRAISMASAVPARALPFRRRDQSLFWCQVETAIEKLDGRPITMAFLQQSTALAEKSSELPPPCPPLPNWLPLLLETNGGIDGWGPQWEKLTGLSACDVEGSRSELVLDWLFPQQHDRDRVADCFHQPDSTGCQLLLEIATPTGGQRLPCTFLPLPTVESAATSRCRWLLLVGGPQLSAAFGTPSWSKTETTLDGVVRIDPASEPHGPHPRDEHSSTP
ncbi:MAG TPA: GAF domain-containing protein [Gemmataceae bacterium]|nr:GAF domain-containing protein [Gemmataceae bacterium]